MYRKKGVLEAEGKCWEGTGGKGQEGKGSRNGKVGGDVRGVGWVGRKKESSQHLFTCLLFQCTLAEYDDMIQPTSLSSYEGGGCISIV